jgi:uncharacterized BrkB/YihY/UPF0761 family membrane protein
MTRGRLVAVLLVFLIAVPLLLFAGLLALIGAFPVMIAFGVLHSYFHGVPPFGYWATAVLLWASAVVLHPLSPSRVSQSQSNS